MNQQSSLELDPVARDLLLQEWKEALATGRHFNDLLIKIRSVALPLIVAAGGLITSADIPVQVPHVPVWATAGVLMAGGVGLFLALMLLDPEWRNTIDPEPEVAAGAHGGEWVVYALAVSLLIFGGAGVLGRALMSGNATLSLPIEVILLPLVALLITSVYALDRFYYFRLLVGAVTRTRAIEQQLHFDLTGSIIRSTPSVPARIIVTLLYGVPAMTAIAGVVLYLMVAVTIPQYSTQEPTPTLTPALLPR